jgi:hypothetical protein
MFARLQNALGMAKERPFGIGWHGVARGRSHFGDPDRRFSLEMITAEGPVTT